MSLAQSLYPFVLSLSKASERTEDKDLSGAGATGRSSY